MKSVHKDRLRDQEKCGPYYTPVIFICRFNKLNMESLPLGTSLVK